jgi:hypothetical protein
MKRKDKDKVKPIRDTKRYLSLVMLPPGCILASRVREPDPDQDDMKYMLRVFEYLNGSTGLGLRYKPDDITLHYWIDASYNLHLDACGHTGIT